MIALASIGMCSTVSKSERVTCLVRKGYHGHPNYELQTDTIYCNIFNQTIDTGNFSIAHEKSEEVQGFIILHPKVKFLIKNIAETFPNLVAYTAWGCSVKRINKHYFKNLRNLTYLQLETNKIETIAADSFKDLTNQDKSNFS